MLTETSLALTSEPTLTLEKMLDLAYEQTMRFVDTDVFYISLFDERTQIISFPLVIESGEKLQPDERVRSHPAASSTREDYRARAAGNGMTEYIIHSGTPLRVVRGFDKWSEEHGVQPVGRPALSWLGAPMKARGRVIGVIAVQDFSREDRFTEVHEMALTVLANQVATAVENVRLFQARERTIAAMKEIVDNLPRLVATSSVPELAKEAVRVACSTWICECGYYTHTRTGGFSLAHASSPPHKDAFPVFVEAGAAQAEPGRAASASEMLVECVSDDSSIEAVLWVKRNAQSAGYPSPFSSDERATLGLFARVLAHIMREKRIQSDYDAARSHRAEEPDAD
jgi:hypothetical protein